MYTLRHFQSSVRMAISSSPATKAFADHKQENVRSLLRPLSSQSLKDTQFWDENVGTALRTLMGGASYDAGTVQANLGFSSQIVAPCLGPRPMQGQAPLWKSFMTDDFSPLEYSWSWEKATPIIRYCFEPIGPLTGTTLDPYNHKAPMEWVNKIRPNLPSADWQLFTHFFEEFYHMQEPALRDKGKILHSGPNQSSPSSIFVGFDLGRNGMVCKVYFVPVKAEQTGQSRFAVLDHAIRTLPNFKDLVAYRHLYDFLPCREQMHIIGVAVDCVDPALSKLKIYFRSPTTTFASVRDVLTAGGSLTGWTRQQMDKVRELWLKVLGLPSDFPDDAELPHNSSETGGVLYNYDIKAGNQEPETKVYIPVKHYGQTDEIVARGLVDFMRPELGHEERHYENFLNTLNKFSSYADPSKERGQQTYISCALKGGKLSLTSYLSPQIYHPGRWSKTPSSL